MTKNSKPFLSFYLVGLFFVLLMLSILIWRFGTNLTFGFADTAYHLGVAQGFARASGVTIWDFWDSLPIGRPHNYPPLFHLLFADLLKTGLRPEIAVKLMIEFSVVGGMVFFSYGITKLSNARTAFWSVLFLALSIQFIRVSATVMPATIVIFMTPLLFYFFKERKWISYIAATTLMLYLHLFLPFVILLGLAIYIIIFEKKSFWITFKATVLALIFYSPWLIHILLSGFKYIKYFDSNYEITRYQNFPQTNLILLILAIFSLISLIVKRKIENKIYFFLIISILFVVMAFFSTDRMLNGHLLVYLALLAAFLFDYFWAKNKILKYFPLLIAIFCLFKMPNLVFNYKFYIDSDRPTVFQVLFKNSLNSNSLEKTYQKLFLDMKKNSEEGESVGTALSYFDNRVLDPKDYQSNIAIFLAANANRPTINLYQPEYSYRSLPDLASARLVLLNEITNNLTPQYFDNFGYSHLKSMKVIEALKNNFVLIGSYQTTKLGEDNNVGYDTHLYRNLRVDPIRETLPRFVFPLWLANVILAVLVIFPIYNNIRINLHKK